MPNQLLNNALKLVGLMALFVTLVVPTADAAATKRSTAKKQQVTKAASTKKAVASRKSVRFVSGVRNRSVMRAAFVPARPSFGEIAGLHAAQDPLDLKSSVALVIDQDTREVLFRKNDNAVLPIA